MTIARHFEHHLGPVQQGWKPTPPTSGIRALLFENQPVQGVDTLATLGLSDEPLPLINGEHVRQELVVSTYPKYPSIQSIQSIQRIISPHLASFLTTFAAFIRSKNQALLRGDVVGPFRPIITGVRASAMYASLPAFFENTFATYRGTEPPTVVVWLVPLVGGEAGFIRQGLRWAGGLRGKLEEHGRFNVIVSCDETGCSVRFHRIRPGESWMIDDLESYSAESVLMIPVGRLVRLWNDRRTIGSRFRLLIRILARHIGLEQEMSSSRH